MSRELRAVPAGGEVPPDVFADKVRENIATRRQRLEELYPEAIDLAARVLVALHRGINGRQEALRGDRAGSVFRREIRGEDALPLEDLARLALEVPTAVRPALAILAHAVGSRLESASIPAPDVSEALASFGPQAMDVMAEGTRALNDGRVSEDERETILREIEATERRLSVLRASVMGNTR